MDRRINIKAETCIIIAISLFLFPLRWVSGWLLAVAAHEVSHLIALFLFQVKVNLLRFDFTGAVIETEAIPPWKEAICAFAGPAGGMILASCGNWVPCSALCAFVHTVFNLLPVYPFDGGRILFCLLQSIMNKTNALNMCRYIGNAVIIAIALLSLYLMGYLRFGMLPVLIAAVLILRCFHIKSPCKAS